MKLNLLLSVILLSITSTVYSQKIDVPAPSEHHYKNAKYFGYIRKFDQAEASFIKAERYYKQKGQVDSVALSQLGQVNMCLFDNRFDHAEKLLLKVQPLIKTTGRTEVESHIAAYYWMMKGRIHLNKYELTEADSLLQIAKKINASSEDSCSALSIGLDVDRAIANHQMSKYHISEAIMLKAKVCSERLFSEKDARQNIVYNMLGNVSSDQGHFKQASEYFIKALEVTDLASGKDSYTSAVIRSNLANALTNLGDHYSAIQISSKALEIAEKAESDYSNQIPISYYNIATMFQALGQPKKSAEYCHRALEFTKNGTGQLAILRYQALTLLSINAYRQKNNSDCMMYFDSAIHVLNKEFGEGITYLADIYQRQAFRELQEENYQNAYDLALKNIQRFEKYGWDKGIYEIGGDYDYAAQAAANLGDTVTAIKYYRLAMDHYPLARQDRALYESRALINLGLIYQGLGKVDSAKVLVDSSIKRLMKVPSHYSDSLKLQPFHFYFFSATELILDHYSLYLKEEYKKSGDPKLLERAKHASELALIDIEQNRSALLEEEDLLAQLNMYWTYYANKIDCDLLLFKHSQDESYLESGISTIESTHDVIRQSFLEKVNASDISNLPDSLEIKEERFTALITSLEEQIQELQLGNDKFTLNQTKDSLSEVKRTFDIFKFNLRDNYTSYFDLKYQRDQLDLDRVKSAIKLKDATVLNYFLGPEKTLLFVLTDSELKYYELGNTKDLQLEINEAIREIKKRGSLYMAHQLYDRLIGPYLEDISTPNLIIIPDGELHYLPFEALMDSKDQFLIEKKNIWYSHSLNQILSISDQKNQNEIIAIAPGFSPSLKKKMESFQGVTNTDLLTSVSQPNAVALVQKLKELYEGLFLLEEDAQENKVKEVMHAESTLHFATHASVNESNPLQSYISLLPDTTGQDGLLYAFEVLGMELNSDLVVLSACETGTGQLSKGQGAISLSYAFRHAGCSNVIMSLWSLDEKPSMKIIEDFHRNWKEGDSKSEALRNSKLSFLETARGELRHPFYWAGMVLVGEGETSHPEPPWLLIGIIFSLTIAIWVVYWKKK